MNRPADAKTFTKANGLVHRRVNGNRHMTAFRESRSAISGVAMYPMPGRDAP